MHGIIRIGRNKAFTGIKIQELHLATPPTITTAIRIRVLAMVVVTEILELSEHNCCPLIIINNRIIIVTKIQIMNGTKIRTIVNKVKEGPKIQTKIQVG